MGRKRHSRVRADNSIPTVSKAPRQAIIVRIVQGATEPERSWRSVVERTLVALIGMTLAVAFAVALITGDYAPLKRLLSLIPDLMQLLKPSG
jgi:hypothetical protein